MDELLLYELPKNIKDIAGQRFARLRAVTFSHVRKGSGALWWFACDCGRYKLLPKSNLGKLVRSCGCLHREAARAQGKASATHGMSKTRLATIFQGMMARCYNTTAVNYDRYGGRGVDICPEWVKNRAEFYAWAVKNGYDNKLEIDRIDNDRGYYPDNCRWVTATRNQNNRRNNILLTHEGTTRTLYDWSRLVGINPMTLLGRMRRGWDSAEVLSAFTDLGYARPGRRRRKEVAQSSCFSPTPETVH